MRPIDRVMAIKLIMSAISEKMSYEDVEEFFNEMNIEPKRDEYGNIDGDLIRCYVSNCSNTILLDIARQLDLTLSVQSSTISQLAESKYWLTDHFRVFISHVHEQRETAGNLKNALYKYGISCFVAHEDIKVSDEWRDEILLCLSSMDAFIAILSDDFGKSKWTDQEVGFAISRDVLIIPINKGVQPYGFIEKYQSLNSARRTVKDVADEVFQTISTNERTNEPMGECLAKLIASGAGANVERSIFQIRKLNAMKNIDDRHWLSIRNSVQATPFLNREENIVKEINIILSTRNIKPVVLGVERNFLGLDEGIPF